MCVCLRVRKVVAVSESPWQGERKPQEERGRVLVLSREVQRVAIQHTEV